MMSFIHGRRASSKSPFPISITTSALPKQHDHCPHETQRHKKCHCHEQLVLQCKTITFFCVKSALCTQSSPNTACPVQEVFPQEMPSEKVWVEAVAGQRVFYVPTECACTGAYLMHWQILDSGARKHGGNMEYLLSITTCSKVCSHEQRVWLSCKESAQQAQGQHFIFCILSSWMDPHCHINQVRWCIPTTQQEAKGRKIGISRSSLATQGVGEYFWAGRPVSQQKQKEKSTPLHKPVSQNASHRFLKQKIKFWQPGDSFSFSDLTAQNLSVESIYLTYLPNETLAA